MPDLRWDPLGRRSVLLAPERARRGAPKVEPFHPDAAPCDFCGGQEQRTPPETFSIRAIVDGRGSAPDTPGWTVRVVPNLYPATPFHEVVVHTPDHNVHYEDQDRAHQRDVVLAYRERLRSASTASVVPVWNRGRAAGASRTHPHGQLFGLDTVPPTLERESVSFAEDECVLCGFASDDDLLVTDLGTYRVIAHPVPWVADELLVVGPHVPRMTDVTDDELAQTAEAFASAVRRSVAFFGDGLQFNFVVHTAPSGVDRFHWHAHLMPRTAVWGGLEMGAELPIVASDPHETAVRLRPADA
jgi:UDPglucose--hexose-1-phosphate uridylyltransferase